MRIQLAKLLLPTTALLTLSAVCYSQEGQTKIKKVSIEYTNPGSGQEMFKAYCAPCHGNDAKGTGPAASALKKAPADLTLLTKKNHGKFPLLEIQAFIRGDTAPAAHGSRDMPMWGDIFRSVSQSPEVVDLRVRNLREYIEKIQEK